MKKLLLLSVIFAGSYAFAQQAQEDNLLNKVERVQREEKAAVQQALKDKEQTQINSSAKEEQEENIVKEILSKQESQESNISKIQTSDNDKQEQQKASAGKGVKIKPVNTDPPGVKWISLSKGKLNVKIQRRTSGISTPNLAMRFNAVYQSLFKNIPWMMGGSADVYVYQDKKDFLANESVASEWSGAFFSPENNRIVLYDEPKNVSKMLSQFQHELTHLFVDHFFSPQGSGKPEAPVWLNEGLAVNMEDIANNYQGGDWARDLVVLNLLPSPQSPAAKLKAPKPISDKTVRFIKFSDFVNNDSYDSAVANNRVEDWYMQAYAMVRFLFKPYNNQYPQKRIQFEQLTKLLSTFQNKRNTEGSLLKDEQGRQIKVRISLKYALQRAYGYNSIDDFEMKFWQWLYPYQADQRRKLKE